VNTDENRIMIANFIRLLALAEVCTLVRAFYTVSQKNWARTLCHITLTKIKHYE